MTAPQTEIASARSYYRAASAWCLGLPRRSSARPPGSGRAPAPAPKHNGQVPESLRCASCALSGAFFPAAGLLQGVGHLARHIAFIVLGEHHIGHEAARIELALGDHALPLAEQIRHNALIAYQNIALAVGDFEANVQIVAALDAAGLDQSADADTVTERNLLLYIFCR